MFLIFYWIMQSKIYNPSQKTLGNNQEFSRLYYKSNLPLTPSSVLVCKYKIRG